MSSFLAIFICFHLFSLIAFTETTQYSSSHFIYIDTYLDWEDASSYCQTYYGTELASTHSFAETNELNQLIPDTDNNMWIGLSDIDTPNEWLWSDETTVNYTNWDTSRDAPDSATTEQNCVVKSGDRLEWNPVLCTNNNPFICNKPLHADYKSDNITYWNLLSETRPISGYTYGTIEMKQSMYLDIKFIYTASITTVPIGTPSDLNIFTIGSSSQNNPCQNNYPGFYTYNNELIILLSDTNTCDTANHYIPIFYLEENVTYTIVMEYNQNHVYIAVNYSDIINDIIYDDVRGNVTNAAIMNQLADIIISDTAYIPSDVTILDLFIHTYEITEMPSTAPSNIPTYTPSNIPTYKPSISPTNIPSISPSDTPTQGPTLSFPYTPIIGEMQCGKTFSGTTTDYYEIYFALVLDLDQTLLNIYACNSDYRLKLRSYAYTRPNAFWYVMNTQRIDCGRSESRSAINVQSDLYYIGLRGDQWDDYGDYEITITCSNTLNPTFSPSNTPSINPSEIPSISPSKYPTINPSLFPSIYPSKYPSYFPSITPTLYPSITPTQTPTQTDEGRIDDDDDITTTEIIERINTESNPHHNNIDITSDLPLSTTQLIIASGALCLLCCICIVICCVRKRRKTPYNEKENKYNDATGIIDQDSCKIQHKQDTGAMISMTEMNGKQIRKTATSVLDENEGILTGPNGKFTVGGMEISVPHVTPKPPPRKKKLTNQDEKQEFKNNDHDSEQNIEMEMNDDAQSYDVHVKLLANSNVETPYGFTAGNDFDDVNGFITAGNDFDDVKQPPPVPPVPVDDDADSDTPGGDMDDENNGFRTHGNVTNGNNDKDDENNVPPPPAPPK